MGCQQDVKNAEKISEAVLAVNRVARSVVVPAVFVLVRCGQLTRIDQPDPSGELMAIHNSKAGFTRARAHELLLKSLNAGHSRDWWYGDGRLFEVFLQRIYFGASEDDTVIGIVVLGYEIDDGVATEVGSVASSQAVFQYRGNLAAGTAHVRQVPDSPARLQAITFADHQTRDIELGDERYIATSLHLSFAGSDQVSLTVMKSYDEATAFLRSLNRWIVVVGIAAMFAGSILVFFVSTTFTRPLSALVHGVRALEEGDFDYPLQGRGSDEVSVLTDAFSRMRLRLRDTQRQLIESERLATIGRMASTISHDLRHPLTAILAYAEFLAEREITEEQRKDFYQEIRIAVNRMTDEISSLLGFSKQREKLKRAFVRVDEIIQHAIEMVKVLPEHQSVEIDFQHDEDCSGWLDPAKVERVMLNLLFNACEAVPADAGLIAVKCGKTERGIEITVCDNGSGIPEAIRETIFQPFVSHGKEKGIGLGLTVVQKIVQDHGGEILIERTGPEGTLFRLLLPTKVAESVCEAPTKEA